ncbi:MAG: gluconokinase [Bacteroidota bacterium]
MDYYIGIDIGTSSTKAVAFSAGGDIVATVAAAYGIQHPRDNYSEQDPAEILQAVINSIAGLTEKCADDNPVLIGFSAAMHSVLAVDPNGQPLTGCIIWADNRAGEIATRLRDTTTGKSFYHKTGVPIHAMSPFCKLLWLKENNPEVFNRAHKFIGIKEYVFYGLFGSWLVDTGIASATGLLNIHTLQWDADILEYAGIQSQQLSTVTSATHQEYLGKQGLYSKDKRLGRVNKTPFIIGGSDGALANLGSGAVSEQAMAISIGTSSAVRIVSSEVYTDEQMRTFCYHLAGNQYIIGGAGNNGAVVLQWLKDTLLQTTETYAQLVEQAEKIKAGCDGLIFVPYILGERAPIWDSNAKGMFFGLTITHTKAHLVRAVMEGVAYSVYSIGRILQEKRNITEIHATGGFTQSPLWPQMVCDLFNCILFVSGAVESSAAGAVKIGLDALRIKTSWLPETTGSFRPNLQLHQIYLRQFEKYERLYPLLKQEF